MFESYLAPNFRNTFEANRVNTLESNDKRSKKYSQIVHNELELKDVSGPGKIGSNRSIKNPETYKEFIDEDNREENKSDRSYGSDDNMDNNYPGFEPENDHIQRIHSKKSKKSKIWIMYYSIIIAEAIMITWALLIWDSLNAFEIIYSGALSLILKTIVWYAIIASYSFRHSNLFGKRNYFINPEKSWIYKSIIIGIIVIVVFFLNWGMMTLVKGMWISLHNSNANGMTLGSFTFTTAVSRHWSKSTWPKDQMPWFVYATLPEDALNSVFINFHINTKSCKGEWNPILNLTVLSSNPDIRNSEFWTQDFTPAKSEYRSPSHEYESRYIYTVLIKDLPKNNYIKFKITVDGWDDPKIYTYKTFSTDGSMTIINGGDIGNNEKSKKLNQNVVSKYEPDVIFVGGDIAYDNNIPEWYQCYDHVMKGLPYQFKDEQNNATRIVPVMFTTGNHDLGVNSYSGHKFKEDATKPVFKHFYPQNTNQNNEVPALKDRRSYYSHSIGDRILFLSLDTGYETKIEGPQTEWLKQQLSRENYKLKFVQYHNPIYSAWSKGDKGEPSTKAKENWVPLFDNYNVTFGLENHVHAYKLSEKIKNGTIDENGTLYIGDGSWGPLVHSWDEINKDIIKEYKIKNHVWVMNIDANNTVNATAYDENGERLNTIEILGKPS